VEAPGTDALTALKRQVVEEVDRLADLLVDVSHRIHGHPETLFEEHFASSLLAGLLEERGMAVERRSGGLETAFSARPAGDPGDGPNVAVLCEYDALPGIGHGCGHNVIAAAGLGAGLALAKVAAEAGGGLTVMGTPAEEGGGGKVHLLDAGAFDGVDVAMMIHPAGLELTEPDVIAIATFEVEYHGRAAHAAAAPHLGRNALDAAVLGYNAVAALRQHIESTERVHGVFSRAGEKPNIVPDHTVAQWYVRSATLDSLQPLKQRVLACLEAGASAAGCRMEARPGAPEYSHLRTNRALVERYRANSESLGRPVADPVPGRRVMVSTDMGNVSLRLPSIHPLLAISGPSVPLHTPEFAEAALSPTGDRAVLEGAKAMALTAVDVWLEEGLMAEIRAQFDGAP